MTIINATVIVETDQWELISHGNGWAYELIRVNSKDPQPRISDEDSLWLQDEDASDFIKEFNYLVEQKLTTKKVCAHMWKMYKE